jgi:hypothetical protein
MTSIEVRGHLNSLNESIVRSVDLTNIPLELRTIEPLKVKVRMTEFFLNEVLIKVVCPDNVFQENFNSLVFSEETETDATISEGGLVIVGTQKYTSKIISMEPHKIYDGYNITVNGDNVEFLKMELNTGSGWELIPNIGDYQDLSSIRTDAEALPASFDEGGVLLLGSLNNRGLKFRLSSKDITKTIRLNSFNISWRFL